MPKFASLVILLSTLTGVLFWLAAPPSFAQTKQEVYDKINVERQKLGFDIIPVDKRLERSAQSWAIFMPYSLKHNVHFLSRLNRSGAECVTVGADPLSSWMKSKSHRQSIMSRGVKAIGLGHWRGKWVLRTFTN